MCDDATVTLNDGTALTAQQRTALEKLRAMLTDTPVASKPLTNNKDDLVLRGAALVGEGHEFLTPPCLRRYLVGRGWNVAKAYDQILATLAWRSTAVRGPFDAAGIEACLRSRYMEWNGHDARGRPTMWIRSANANLDIPREQRLSFLVAALEKGLSLMAPDHHGDRMAPLAVEQWTMVVDETDKEMRHMDNKFLSQVAPILSSHYVERLHRCYIVNPGILTSMVLTAVKLFVDERTSSKIVMIDAKPDKANKAVMPLPRLIAELGAENVPVCYGGTLPPRTLDEYREFFHSVPPSVR